MIILASTSRTRQALLTNAGIEYRSVSPGVDERKLLDDNPHWTPSEASLRLASAKATAVSAQNPSDIVIGADQVLALGTVIFSKPRDLADAHRQLVALRGKTHVLISTVVCAFDGTPTWSCRQECAMRMRNFSDAFLENYLEAVGPSLFSSVGGYQLEGRGVQLFDKVDGDYFSILGMPMIPLLNHLRFVKALAT